MKRGVAATLAALGLAAGTLAPPAAAAGRFAVEAARIERQLQAEPGQRFAVSGQLRRSATSPELSGDGRFGLKGVFAAAIGSCGGDEIFKNGFEPTATLVKAAREAPQEAAFSPR